MYGNCETSVPGVWLLMWARAAWVVMPPPRPAPRLVTILTVSRGDRAPPVRLLYRAWARLNSNPHVLAHVGVDSQPGSQLLPATWRPACCPRGARACARFPPGARSPRCRYAAARIAPSPGPALGSPSPPCGNRVQLVCSCCTRSRGAHRGCGNLVVPCQQISCHLSRLFRLPPRWSNARRSLAELVLPPRQIVWSLILRLHVPGLLGWSSGCRVLVELQLPCQQIVWSLIRTAFFS